MTEKRQELVDMIAGEIRKTVKGIEETAIQRIKDEAQAQVDGWIRTLEDMPDPIPRDVMDMLLKTEGRTNVIRVESKGGSEVRLHYRPDYGSNFSDRGYHLPEGKYRVLLAIFKEG